MAPVLTVWPRLPHKNSRIRVHDYRKEATAVVTEVFTRKYCDQHAVREEKVEATDVIQFAWDGAVREIDACDECKKEYETRFEPLVDYSRPFKKRRAKKTETKSESEDTPTDVETSSD